MDAHNLKVFISSTFCDLDKEREYLVQVVFPRIRAKLNGITVNEIDLRWGITDEESREKRVVDLCLHYLYESKPFFIGILGRRYGSVISPSEVDLSPLVEEVYPQVVEDLVKGRSITEIEILNGVLRAPEEHRPKAIFFIQETEAPWVDEDSEKFKKLQALKQTIYNQKTFPVYPLKKLEDLEVVVKFILDNIEKEPERGDIKTGPKDLNLLINAYNRQVKKYQQYKPDNYYVLDCLMPILERARPVAVLEGMEGSGKSCLVAQLGNEYHGSKRIFIHLYGNVAMCPSPNSFFFTQLFMEMAKRILAHRFEEKANQNNFSGWFTRFFQKTNLNAEEELVWEIARHQWCIVLDNVNALSLQTFSPMLQLIPTIINNFLLWESRFKKKIDYRILLVQNSNSPYSLPDGKYEKFSMPQNTLDSGKFIDNYLSSYSKHLNKDMQKLLKNSALTSHPRSLFLVCEYLRESVKHEQLGAFMERIKSFKSTNDTYMIYVERLLSSFEESAVRRLSALISLFSYGMSQKHLEDLSGMSSIDFYHAWASLSKLTTEEQDGAIHWKNDAIKRFMDQTLHLTDESLRSSLAKECLKYFFNSVDKLFTPEKLHHEIKKAWWLWKNDLILSLPNREESILELRQMGEMNLAFYFQRKGCFKLEYVRKYVYPHVLSRNISQGFSNAANEAMKEDGGASFIDVLKNKSGRMTELFFTKMEKMKYYREPTPVELLCYLESLCLCKKWKQLEVELANPEVLNYVWNTSVVLDCWLIGMKEGKISIIQPDQKYNDKMLLISSALGNDEGIKYYSEAQKK